MFCIWKDTGESSERQREKELLFLGLEQSCGEGGVTDAWTVGLVALGSVSPLDSLPILVECVEGEVLGEIWKFWEGSVKEETNVTAVLGWPQTQKRDKGWNLEVSF